MVIGAGALQPDEVWQVAKPFPYLPPNTNPPLIIEGTTATHLADERTSLGIPLSGAAMTSSRTLDAASMRFTRSSSLSLSLAYMVPLIAANNTPTAANTRSSFIDPLFMPFECFQR